jgi:hypothetical protein
MAALRDMPIHLSGRRLERVLATGLSRAQFMRRAAVAAGGVAGYGLLAPQLAQAANSAPRPIPGGLDGTFTPVPSDPFVHVLPPAVGFEMSTITDFNGLVAAAEMQGTAHGSDGSHYTFDAGMRFMQGVYVGMDGRHRQGAFGFI